MDKYCLVIVFCITHNDVPHFQFLGMCAVWYARTDLLTLGIDILVFMHSHKGPIIISNIYIKDCVFNHVKCSNCKQYNCKHYIVNNTIVNTLYSKHATFAGGLPLPGKTITVYRQDSKADWANCNQNL